MIKKCINKGNAILGIELGSTRIKAILIDETHTPIESGVAVWENKLQNGFWTYSIENIHTTLRAAFKDLSENIQKNYGVTLKTVKAIGISAMMHGYLPFDKEGNLLAPFRTWRNTTTERAAASLSELFHMNIPQRWSIAHLYEAILNGEEHVKNIAHLQTLAGYIHFLLTGKWELGIGDASGMFPITGSTYDKTCLDKFTDAIEKYHFPWKINDILPTVKTAGEKGAFLTAEGAAFLDPSGNLQANIPVCPPEGDAGTGMVATNAVLPGTGNLSAGTSIFAMLVTEKPLENMNPNIDVVTTPAGHPVAMVHCNNCTGELDAWINIFYEASQLFGADVNKDSIYSTLYNHALTGDTSGIIAYNYLSGEHTTGILEGRPMYFRLPDTKINLAGFMKSQLFSLVATLKLGMDALRKNENIPVTKLCVHGGLFKVKNVAHSIVASALKTSVAAMETAEMGGAWGMALLAAYMTDETDKPLGEWLDKDVFSLTPVTIIHPDEALASEYENYLVRYTAGLAAEKKLEEVK